MEEERDIVYRSPERTPPPGYDNTPKYSMGSVYFSGDGSGDLGSQSRTSEFNTARHEDFVRESALDKHSAANQSHHQRSIGPSHLRNDSSRSYVENRRETWDNNNSRTFRDRTERGKNFQDLMSALPSQHPDALETAARIKREHGAVTTDFLDELGSRSRQSSFQDQASRQKSRRKTIAASRRGTLFNMIKAVSTEEASTAFADMDVAKANIKEVKNSAAPLSEKIDRVREEQEVVQQSRKHLDRFTLWYALFTQAIKSRLDRVKLRIKQWMTLWGGSIKLLAGKHGAAVGTFFQFCRAALFFNLLIALLWIAFVILPFSWSSDLGFGATDSIVPSIPKAYSSADTFLGLFTGGAQLNYSAYFIGTYFLPNKAVTSGAALAPVSPIYNLPLAYLLIGGLYLFVSFVFIFRQVYIAVYYRSSISKEQANTFADMLLASYDFSLMDEKSIDLKRVGLIQLVRETIAEQQALEQSKNNSRFKQILLKRIVVNLAVFCILALALYIIQLTVSTYSKSGSDLTNLIAPLILSVFNVVLPIAFERLSVFEEWRTNLFVVQITVVRMMIMRIAGLFVFFYTIFLNKDLYMCWESFVGQYVYKLFLITMFVEIIMAAVTRPMEYIFTKRKFRWFPQVLRDQVPIPRFDTINATINLIYAQTIVMFGTFFCPLLPLLGMLRVIALFYLERFITLRFCEPPQRAFKAYYSFSELFYAVLLLMLFCVAFPLGYAITRLPTSGVYASNAGDFVSSLTVLATPCVASNATCPDCLAAYSPSAVVCWVGTNYPTGAVVTMSDLCSQCPTGCGPFRNQGSMYDTAITEYHKWTTTAQNAIETISTTSFASLVVLLLIIGWLYTHAQARGRLKMAEDLAVERDLERMDKIWILEKYSITLDDSGPKGRTLQQRS
eukprot:m.149762 g.149762  ORF g.149762 m.149762 type:complete len:898 (+) comp9732_c0_seq11:38-2731(+)